MPALTSSQISKLNNVSPGARQVGLGTIINNLMSGNNFKAESGVGKVNTNYAMIDNCEAKNMDTADAASVFTGDVTTDRFKIGTKSFKLQSLTTSSTLTYKVYNAINSADWSGSDTFGMWVFCDTHLDEGDVRFYIKATTGGAQYINLPEIDANTFVWIELPKGAVTCADVIEYGFQRHAAKLFELYVDNIVRFLAAETTVLASTPIFGSVKIFGQTTEEAAHHAPTALAEGTDFSIGVDSKRIIYITDQSAKNCFVMYAA